jgi:hypothetical protein
MVRRPMPRFKVLLSGRGLLNVSGEFEIDDVRIEPQDNLLGLRVSVVIQSQDVKSAEKEALRWARKLEEGIALATKQWVEFKLESIETLPSSAQENEYSVSRAYVAFSSIVPRTIGRDVLTEALGLIPKLSIYKDDDLIARAVRWYARGIEDNDFVDKFIDHWIGLETLSSIYEGEVEPYTCPGCGRVLNARPQGAVLFGFVESLKLPVDPRDYVRKLRDIRGGLFHEAKAMEEARIWQPILTDLFKACLLRRIESRD